jgi:hypothetical protein
MVSRAIPSVLLSRFPPHASPVPRIQRGVLRARRALAPGKSTRSDSRACVRGVPRYVVLTVDDASDDDDANDDDAKPDTANSDAGNSDNANSDDVNDDANDADNSSGRAARPCSHRDLDA